MRWCYTGFRAVVIVYDYTTFVSGIKAKKKLKEIREVIISGHLCMSTFLEKEGSSDSRNWLKSKIKQSTQINLSKS